MRFTSVILKVNLQTMFPMKSTLIHSRDLFSKEAKTEKSSQQRFASPFWVMVRKEVGDHIRSWRLIVMLILIVLTFLGTMSISLGNIRSAVGNLQEIGRASCRERVEIWRGD